jgi:hypothetical protein
VLPTPEELAARGRQATGRQVRGRPGSWRARGLSRLGRVSGWTAVEGDKGYIDYQKHLSELLALPPRYWLGWEIQDGLLIWHLLRELLPAPVQDHLKTYWQAWLQPDLPTDAFVHPQSRDAVDYWKRNHDWRGRASFFRGGYNFAVGTQNFNHTAAMGALLGGAMIGSANAMADGRHGLETLLLRFWGFLDGTTQEVLDHYYLSITLSSQKMFADFAPSEHDRLMGRILLTAPWRCWSPLPFRLRRCVIVRRARLSGVLVNRTASMAPCTASRRMAPSTISTSRSTPQCRAWRPGLRLPAGRAAIQACSAVAPLGGGPVDDKPVPFEETAAETTRGNFNPPLWRRSYLGRWHGLASADIRGGTVDVLGQWVRAPQRSARLEDLGTLTVRYAAGEPDLFTTQEGLAQQAGLTLTYQSRNRAIVFAKPHGNRERLLAALGKNEVSRLATVIGLWNFADKKDWEIYADDRRIEGFPQHLDAGQRILIRDGVSYLAILPLPSADLGRDVAIEIGPAAGGKASPALVISMFNMKRATAVPAGEIDLDAVMRRTYGSRAGDGRAEQHGGRGLRPAYPRQPPHRFLARTSACRSRLQGGEDLMEAGFTTDFGQPAESHFASIRARRRRPFPTGV